MYPYHIAPSILAADFARLGEESQAVLDAGADRIHVDVMDNHYVPNLSIGPYICSALRDYGIKTPLDAHLMVQPVDELIKAFAKAGASTITIHPEATNDLAGSVQLIIDEGCKAACALNPDTPLTRLDDVIDKLVSITIMSVHPGFAGQAFLESSLDKIRDIAHYRDEHYPELRLQVDGGVKVDNIGKIAAAGADSFVAGSAIFASDDYAATIKAMRAEINDSVT